MTRVPRILCFADVLCGHSYIAHARLEQLRADFGDRLELTVHFRSTYGDVHGRIAASGMTPRAYNARARAVAARYEHVAMHPDLFCERVPTSSMPAHLYLRAVALLEQDGIVRDRFARMQWAVQLAFFRDLADVSRRSVLDDIARDLDIPTQDVARVIDDGRAHAALDRDARLERRYNIQMTPTLVLDDGRQVLNGNVGYRVIEANIRELLSRRPAEHGWC